MDKNDKEIYDAKFWYSVAVQARRSSVSDMSANGAEKINLDYVVILISVAYQICF